MTTLLVFVGIELAAFVALMALILGAPEAMEDHRGFRVIGPSLWQRLRRGWAGSRQPKLTQVRTLDGRTRA